MSGREGDALAGIPLEQSVRRQGRALKLPGSRRLSAMLRQGLQAHEVRLEARHIAALSALWPSWLKQQDHLVSANPQGLAACFLQSQVERLAQDIALVREAQLSFTRRYALGPSEDTRREIILDYASELGASRRQLRGDRRAFKRWFGADAMHDRARLHISQAERMLGFCLQALGRTAAQYLAQSAYPANAWRKLALEETVLSFLRWDGDARVQVEAFRTVSAVLKAMPPDVAAHAMRDTTSAYVYRAALDTRLDVWIQREALSLLKTMAPASFASVIRTRLEQPADGDDLFVRRHAVELLADSLQVAPVLEQLYGIAANDPSPFVRQAVAAALVKAGAITVRTCWPRLGLDDAAVEVRAAAALQLPLLAARPELVADARAWTAQVLQQESAAFGLRAALKAVENGVLTLQGDGRERWIEQLLPTIETLHCACPHLPVRRWAAETRERIWCHATPQAAALHALLTPIIRQCAAGATRWLPAAAAPTRCKIELAELTGRVLAVLAQRDHGIGLERTWRGWRMWRGHRFGFRLWRLLHEWRHPSPDKRQAFRHTLGRLFKGSIRAPSAILGELAETKVPGEALHMGSEGGWRPYLPLVDELISLLDESPAAGPLRLFTAEGVTEIQAPAAIGHRIAARMTLTRHFARYAAARNWREGSASHAAGYVRQLTELGFALRHRAYPGTSSDAAVTRFFSALLGMPWPVLSTRLENYFYSAYDNSLFDLTIFITVAILAFLAHHWWANRRMRSARDGIPLVIGGWGTRGKSGTERLKAAMFNAQGYSVVSKTTGCEAMFLYAPPYGELREMFLFRLYDKATIWEQFNVVRLTHRLGGEVFLWECMALTPAFVRLLQRCWMRDDYATLTNTFPDHEDLQGPAGVNIPQVMTEFIPRGRMLLTTEEQMRPILQTAADALGTELKGTGWLEAGLIPPDVLARFPYQEHPDNIALVAALGRELGIGYDYAVKAMADRVVPDLGVLKTFPPAVIDTRTLEFSNGMSANERYGCLGNWTRLGFDRHDPQAEPSVIISTVVNNRADRIARSRVFSGVLVQDIRADFHVLIGSNLDGMRGYLRESWNVHARTLTLWPAQSGGDPATVLASLARSFRIVHTDAALSMRLQVMLTGIGAPATLVQHAGDPPTLAHALALLQLPHAADVIAFHERDVAMRREYAALEERCSRAAPLSTTAAGSAADSAATAAPDPTLDQALRAQLWAWFERRIVVVDDYHASGDAVIAAICHATPPGFHNRIMGLQNIKGTGLDFVYRWLAWDICHRACTDLLTRDPIKQRRALTTLGGFQEYGVLCEQKMLQLLEEIKTNPFGQQERAQAELAAIAATLTTAMREVRARINSARSTGWQEKLLSAIEGFLDAGDAVHRRRQADRIYRDLVQRRISEARAARELQALTQRQKGGWLSAAFNKFLQRGRC